MSAVQYQPCPQTSPHTEHVIGNGAMSSLRCPGVEQREVSMGSAMIPGVRHDEAVDPSAPKATMRCEKQFGLLGAPPAICDREWGHSGSHSAAGASFTGARDERDERRTAAVVGIPREPQAAGLTAEQQIRARAGQAAATFLAGLKFDGLDDLDDAGEVLVVVTDHLARYIATGDITPATLDDLDVPDEAPVLTRAAGQPRAYQRTTVDDEPTASVPSHVAVRRRGDALWMHDCGTTRWVGAAGEQHCPTCRTPTGLWTRLYEPAPATVDQPEAPS